MMASNKTKSGATKFVGRDVTELVASNVDWATMMETETNALANIEAKQDILLARQSLPSHMSEPAGAQGSRPTVTNHVVEPVVIDSSHISNDLPYECYLWNLPFSIVEDDLARVLTKCALVEPTHIRFLRTQNQFSGRAIVTLSKRDDVIRLIGLSDLIFMEGPNHRGPPREVKIRYSDPPQTPRVQKQYSAPPAEHMNYQRYRNGPPPPHPAYHQSVQPRMQQNVQNCSRCPILFMSFLVLADYPPVVHGDMRQWAPPPRHNGAYSHPPLMANHYNNAPPSMRDNSGMHNRQPSLHSADEPPALVQSNVPAQRPKLILKPRTSTDKDPNAPAPERSSAIFGSATIVDTTQKFMEIELKADKEREERRQQLLEQQEGEKRKSESESTAPVDQRSHGKPTIGRTYSQTSSKHDHHRTSVEHGPSHNTDYNLTKTNSFEDDPSRSSRQHFSSRTVVNSKFQRGNRDVGDGHAPQTAPNVVYEQQHAAKEVSSVPTESQRGAERGGYGGRRGRGGFDLQRSNSYRHTISHHSQSSDAPPFDSGYRGGRGGGYGGHRGHRGRGDYSRGVHHEGGGHQQRGGGGHHEQPQPGDVQIAHRPKPAPSNDAPVLNAQSSIVNDSMASLMNITTSTTVAGATPERNQQRPTKNTGGEQKNVKTENVAAAGGDNKKKVTRKPLLQTVPAKEPGVTIQNRFATLPSEDAD